MNKILSTAITIIFVALVFMPSQANALEPKLLWEKEFKAQVYEVDFAYESADVILTKGKNEIVVYDKSGNEKFHWGPRIDRHCGGVSISKDGRFFMFYSGYTERFALEKKVKDYSDDQVHFYSGETKKELWSMPGLETVPVVFPDGSGFLTAYPVLEIVNLERRIIYRHPEQIGGFSFAISPDSGYFAVVPDSDRPLILFKRDGTVLWERGRHTIVSSISDGASYITTQPYILGYDSPDSENTHLGTVYDKNGNKVMEGFGIVSGNGKRLVMREEDSVSIYSLPDKKLIRNIPGRIDLPKVSNTFFAAFSYEGNYLVMRDGDSIHVYDLIKNINAVIEIAGLGRFPYIAITTDARHLFVHPTKGNKILLYKLY